MSGRCMPGVGSRSFTREDMNKIAALRTNNVPWKRIAEIFGCSEWTVLGMYRRFRNNKIKFVHEVREERARIALSMRLDGKTNADVGRALGISGVAAFNLLARRGWDAETIGEERKLLSRQVSA